MNWDLLHSYAYTPYSGNAASCVVRGESGTLYPGVRVENISYPLTITAEQAAITSCLSESDSPAELIYQNLEIKSTRFWDTEFNLQIKESKSFPVGKPFQAVGRINGTIKKHLDHLKEKAVTPNSSFPVSALLETDQGIIEGVNIEFSAWHLGLCAERVAIAKAISAGVYTFKKLSIYVSKSEFTSPCGACRQVIGEFMYHQPIELYHGNGTFSSYPAKEFLPYALHTSSLKKGN